MESHDDAHLSELADRALLLLRSLPSLDYEEREQRALATQLHTSGISLWNRTVTLKSAGAVSLNLNAQSRLMEPWHSHSHVYTFMHNLHTSHAHIHLIFTHILGYNAVRHIACNLVLMANPSEPSESSFHKQITVRAATSPFSACCVCKIRTAVTIATVCLSPADGNENRTSVAGCVTSYYTSFIVSA